MGSEPMEFQADPVEIGGPVTSYPQERVSARR